MADPLRKPVYDPEDDKPVIRPRLRSVDGAGEGDGKASGKLNAVDAGSKPLDKPALRALEGGGQGDGIAKGRLGLAGRDESEKLGRGFTGEDSKRGFLSGGRFSLKNWTKKKVATYAVVGVLGGGTIFGGTILQGPFQLVHFAQLLTKFHLQVRADESDSRVGKLGRYMYYLKGGYGAKGGVERTRMGVLGNKYADTITKKMKLSGIEPNYDKITGVDKGYKIVPKDLEGKDLDKHVVKDRKGKIDNLKTAKNLEKAINAETGLKVKASVEGDHIKIDGDRNTLKSRKLLKFMLKKSGYGKFSSAMLYRPMAKRAGISLHPLRAADRKVLLKAEEKYSKWRGEKQKQYSGGDSEMIKAGSGIEEEEGATENDKNEAKKANEAREGAEKDLKANEPKDTKLAKAMESKTFKATAGAAAIAGLLCLAKDINDGATKYKEAKVILPAMRIAGDFISLGSQIQDGNKDLDMETVGFYSKQLGGVDSSGEKSSWMNAMTTRSELNKEGGVDANGTLKSIGKGGPLDSVIGVSPVKQAVSAVCSTGGRIITGVFGAITGPVTAAITTPAGMIFGPKVIGLLIDWLSPNPLDLFPVGADLGNTANYGARLSAREQGASTGGRELSPQESAQRKLEVNEESSREMSKKNIATRIFDLYDYRSIASQTLDAQVLTVDNLASILSSPFKSFGKIFSSLITPKILADGAGYDYGFNDIGFSETELDSDATENPYKNADEVIKTILPSHPEYIDRAKKCMGVEIDATTYDIVSLQAIDKNLEMKDLSSKDCTDKSQAYLKFRTYVFDTQTMMTLACYEADDTNPDDAEGTKACTDLGMEGDTTGSDASSGALASGEAKDLAKQILDSGKVSGDPRYMNQIKAVSEGNDSCHINPTILQVIKTLVDKDYKLYISSLNRKCTGVLTASGEASYHYSDRGGHAVDFSMINGTATSGRDENARDLLRDLLPLLPSGSGIGQIGCGQGVKLPNGIVEFADSCNHLHIQVPKK